MRKLCIALAVVAFAGPAISLAQDAGAVSMRTESARFGFQRLVVRDLAKQAKFYRDALGFPEVKWLHSEIKGRPMDEVIFSGRDGKIDFIVLAFSDDKPGPHPGGTLSAFFTPDLAALESSIIAAGGSVYLEIRPMQKSSKMTRTAFYSDPEGNIFQVIED